MLARALAKLALVVGEDAGRAVEIRLGEASEEYLTALRRAARQRRRVVIEYFATSRDALSERTIEPGRVFSSGGHWYVAAWCDRAGGPRVFRVDRIRALRQTDEPSRQPLVTGDDGVFTPDESTPRVELLVEPSGSWIVEQYPVEHHEVLDGGRHRIRLAVSSRPWFERLLLRLGGDLVAATGDPPFTDPVALRAAAARRILAIYDDPSAG